MDTTALIVGTVIGAAIAGALALALLRTSGTKQALSVAELDAKREQLHASEIARAQLEERCVRLSAVEAELAAEVARCSALQTEMQDYQLEIREHAGQIASEQRRIADREELLQKSILEKTEFLEKREAELKAAFDNLAAEALRKSRQDFLNLADERFKAQAEQSRVDLDTRQKAINTLVQPLTETLKAYQENLNKVELERASQTQRISQQIEAVNKLQEDQKTATSDLRGLLRGPTTRGRVGEMFLKRLLDSVGLQENIHYRMQVTSVGDDGRTRPDCVIYLPSGKCLVVDAKTPLNAYEDAYTTQDETVRAAKLKEHARNVRSEIDRLSKRGYEDVDGDVEHVIMYLPIEASLSAAYEVDPEIHTFGWNKSVVLASPTLLYLFLHMVRNDWRQHDLAKNAREIEKLGAEMVDRIRIVAKHISSVGKNLDGATKSYNDAVASIDRNLITTAGRLSALGAKSKEAVVTARTIDHSVRSFDKPILQSTPDDERIAALEADSLFEVAEAAHVVD